MYTLLANLDIVHSLVEYNRYSRVRGHVLITEQHFNTIIEVPIVTAWHEVTIVTAWHEVAIVTEQHEVTIVTEQHGMEISTCASKVYLILTKSCSTFNGIEYMIP